MFTDILFLFLILLLFVVFLRFCVSVVTLFVDEGGMFVFMFLLVVLLVLLFLCRVGTGLASSSIEHLLLL